MSFSFGDYNPNPNPRYEIAQRLNWETKRRFIGGLDSHFYLLNVERVPEGFRVTLSGSTRNIYYVIVNEQQRKVGCNCPDGNFTCQVRNINCKHSNFVIFKVLQMWELGNADNHFFRDNVLSEGEYDTMSTKLNELVQRFNGELTAESYIVPEFAVRYQNHMERTTKVEEMDIDQVLESQFACLSIKKDCSCAICYNDLQESEELVACPTCKNQFHANCMNQWLQHGHNSCVYCRDTVWQEYKNDTMGIEHQGTHVFLNLNTIY